MFIKALDRFVHYFEKRGRHEVTSFIQSTIGIFSMLFFVDTNAVIGEITAKGLTRETLSAFLGAAVISLFKAACFAASNNKDFLRTPDKK